MKHSPCLKEFLGIAAAIGHVALGFALGVVLIPVVAIVGVIHKGRNG